MGQITFRSSTAPPTASSLVSPPGIEPDAIAYNSANGGIYVPNFVSGNATVIRAANDSVVGSVSVGVEPDAIAVDSSLDVVYVANAGTFNVSSINGATNASGPSLPHGSVPGRDGLRQRDG